MKKVVLLLVGACLILGSIFILYLSRSSPPVPVSHAVPTKISDIPPTLSAAASLAVFVDGGAGKERVLTESAADAAFPIASITKLMTALVASKHFSPNDSILISADALSGKGVSGNYHAGQSFTFSNALAALLIASHNEIGIALAIDYGGIPAFVAAMNDTAKTLGMLDTVYVNPSGLDPDAPNTAFNKSSARNLYVLARYLKENNPEILAVTGTKAFTLTDTTGTFSLPLTTTDELVGTMEGLLTVIAGKTGETPRAKQNLVIVASAPCGGTLYAVVLDSADRFADMRTLLSYANTAYDWTCSPIP